MRSCNEPLITVITASYKSADFIAGLGDSLRAQVFKDFEWVVADGGSKDGTVEIIQSFDDILGWWCSETDGGIYSAWNKALRHARGKWIIFLGADDRLVDGSVFQDFASVLFEQSDRTLLVYGRIAFVDRLHGSTIAEFGRPWREHNGVFRWGKLSLPLHPEVFHARSVFHSLAFDESYRICADLKVLIEASRSCVPVYFPRLVTRMASGGVSSKLSAIRLHFFEEARVYRELGVVVPIRHQLLRYSKLAYKTLLAAVPARASEALLNASKSVWHRFVGLL